MIDLDKVLAEAKASVTRNFSLGKHAEKLSSRHPTAYISIDSTGKKLRLVIKSPTGGVIYAESQISVNDVERVLAYAIKMKQVPAENIFLG